MSFSAFLWTSPKFLCYHCCHHLILHKLVPVLSFFTFSKILGLALPTFCTPFVLPSTFEIPVTVYSRFHKPGFSLQVWQQPLWIYLKVEEMRRAFLVLVLQVSKFYFSNLLKWRRRNFFLSFILFWFLFNFNVRKYNMVWKSWRMSFYNTKSEIACNNHSSGSEMVCLNKLAHIQFLLLWSGIFQTKILLFLVNNCFSI